MNGSAILTISRQSFVDAITSKWLMTFAAIFFALSASVTLLSFFADGFNLAIAQQLCDSYCPPDLISSYLASFVAAVYPYIPLLSLPMGAALIVEERELGTLQYIMSNPISKADFLLGRMLGMLVATTTVVIAGFAVATIFVFGNDYALYPPFAVAAGAAILLNGIMLFLAMIVSALTRRKATAIATAVILWLTFTVVGNAGNLSEYLSLKLGPWSTLPVMVLNPIDASQNWAMLGLHQDLTGATITGLMITELFQQYTTYVLAGILFSWVLVCFLGAFLLFRHQDVV